MLPGLTDILASTGVILLAAGASSRLGQPKQLLPFEGKTLLLRAAETAVAAGGAAVVVVTGAQHATLLPELIALPVTTTHNPHWAEGMGSSIKAGLTALETLPRPAKLTGIIVLLCDQPLVTPELLVALLRQHLATQQPIVASAYGGTLGVPAFFAAAVFPALRQLSGAAGARQLIAHHGAAVATVAFPAGVLDVDTRAQYEELLRLNGAEDGFV